MKKNLLLCTDVYKFGHLYQYPPGTQYVYSYLQARKPGEDIVFYGLQYYIKEYLHPITREDVDEFVQVVESILGPGMVDRKHYDALADLGYLPLEIRAVAEGMVIPSQNVLMTITNTHPDFAWLVGYVESLLLKVWNSCTVATNSRQLRLACEHYADSTCDDRSHVGYQVHDFGYRGCSSEETAAISGSAHLISFMGSDTVPAVSFINKYYPLAPHDEPRIAASVPATEHSVMCAYGRENELEAFRQMLKTYPTGIVSIVSDSYDLWNVLENFTEELREEILNRDGKVVFRPDSGKPLRIICGDSFINQIKSDTPEEKGALQILWEKFGGHINKKGYKVLNPKVGLIYGDGIYPKVMVNILATMERQGFASSNIVFGVGGLLLQNFSRDTYGFTMKASHCIVNGEAREIYKDPVTDKGKSSHKGYMKLVRDKELGFKTVDSLGSLRPYYDDELEVVFRNGEVGYMSFTSVRYLAFRD